jgi:hypothetical protein
MAKKPQRWAPTSKDNKTEDRLVDLIDTIADFEEFRLKVLPAIQQDVKAGLSAEELRKKYHALVQARQITALFLETDHSKAASVAQQLIDRTEGKSVERQETTHKFENLSDAELDAVLNSKLNKIKSDEELSSTEH